MTNLILGAGFTGLAAGCKTGWPIYESTASAGGTCKSVCDAQYRFERCGGHWLFGNAQTLEWIDHLSPLNHYRRQAGVYINQIYPYPIQEYMGRTETVAPGMMKAWLWGRFGINLCRLFFWDFHDKYLAGMAEEILPDDAQKSPTHGPGYNEQLAYPKLGLDHLVDMLAADLDIHYGYHAQKIDLQNKVLRFDHGEEIQYDRIVSTIPLNQLLEMCGISEVSLPYTSVKVTNVGGIPGPKLPKEHWIYLPDKNVGPFRVGIYTNMDRMFAPDERMAFYVEEAMHSEQDTPPTGWLEIMAMLKDWKWLEREDVFYQNIVDVAYTWINRESNVGNHLAMLKSHGIESIGRYGKWKFQGIVQSIEDGLAVT